MTRDEEPEEEPDKIIVWVRNVFPPTQRAALEYFRRFIDDGMLLEIAQADYIDDAEKHLKVLRPLRDGGEIREMHTWYPMEVLELMRWIEPDDPQRNEPGCHGLRGHRMRAFCCAALLATPNFESDRETLIRLLDSAAVMGEEALAAVGRFLVWQIETGHWYSVYDRVFFVLALVAVAIFLDPGMEISRETELAAWMSQEERESAAGWRRDRMRAPGFFNPPHSDDLRGTRWMSLIEKVRERSGCGPLGELLAKAEP